MVTQVLHVGDYVRVHDYGIPYNGQTGHLRPKEEGYGPHEWIVALDEGGNFYGTDDTIELVDNLAVAETPVDAW